MPRAYIAFGSNLGDRTRALDRAGELLRAQPGIDVLRTSSYRETRPVGGPPGQGFFLNAVAELDTNLPPAELLAVLRRIEHSLGRTRHERWEPRRLDLDLLFYDDFCLKTSELTLPHPRIPFRRFVLEPLAEISPDFVHPTLQRTIRDLVDHLRRTPRRLLIAAADASHSSRLAQAVAAKTSAVLISAEPRRPTATQLAPDSSDDSRRILEAIAADRWRVSTTAVARSSGAAAASEEAFREVPTLVARLDASAEFPPGVLVLDLVGLGFEDQLVEILAAMGGIED